MERQLFFVLIKLVLPLGIGCFSHLQSQPTIVVSLADIVKMHYREPESFVNIQVLNGNSSLASSLQNDLISDILQLNSDWLVVAYSGLPVQEKRPAYYNVFFIYDSLSFHNLVDSMHYDFYHFHGLYTIFVENGCEKSILSKFMQKLWSLQIINDVIICKDDTNVYVAYSYHPYRENQCGSVEPLEEGRFIDNVWQNLNLWFPEKMKDLHGCVLVVATVNVKPYSMIHREGNRTVHHGIEVTIAENIASIMNFSLLYVLPKGNERWGVLQAKNSTGLLGMIQRNEADFGFGSIGCTNARSMYVRLGAPSHVSKMLMAVPPKRPYTSLQKMFLPFTLESWMCIMVSYAIGGLIANAMFNLPIVSDIDKMPYSIYTLWTLLMGGSCQHLHLNSTRMFMISFIVNALVVRTLYHAGMFDHLQASTSHSTDLNTLADIDNAGLVIYMYKTTADFFNSSSIIRRRIRYLTNLTGDWEDLLYDISQHKSDGVIALPLECIAYYIKRNGKRGLDYPGKHTGVTYNTAFAFPKTSSLQQHFDALMMQFNAAGLSNIWLDEFHDERFWSDTQENPEPTKLHWNHVSGAFYLCGISYLVATVVFVAEMCSTYLKRKSIGKRNHSNQS